jgi:ATP-dependent protease ClpP protease subunit
MRLLLTIPLLLLSMVSHGAELRVDPTRLVRVIGEVNGSMLPLANRIDQLSAQSDEPIYLLINSPGGSIVIGNLIINSMNQAKARGSRIVCVSTLIAASMAFQFLVECDERYAMRYTKLLFHPPRVMLQGGLKHEDLSQLSTELRDIENKMVPRINEVLKMDAKEFRKNYLLETLWDAEDLIRATNTGWLHLIDSVEGVSDVFQIRPDNAGPRFQFEHGTLVWDIHTKGSSK